MKIVLGMSGGVDSSVAAFLIKEKKHECIGLTLKLFGDGDINDAKKVCEKLDINHSVLDLSDTFKSTVISNFLSEYENGRTPNPCIVCNEKIKFGEMLNFSVNELKAHKIATGHYAVIENNGGRFLLKKPCDLNKDQTYVLYGLTQKQLSLTCFPLGLYKKSEIREIALENGFFNANKKDSQDICFVPDGDYAKFIKDTTKKKFAKGAFLDLSGNILGEHNGIINYTVGQRKGLGIALGKPMFVINKNALNNTVTLGDEEHLMSKTVTVKNINYIPFDTLNSDMKVKAKLRYSQAEEDAVLHPVSETEAVLEFSRPQRAPSVGQSAVFYDEDYVVGGGIIEKGYNND